MQIEAGFIEHKDENPSPGSLILVKDDSGYQYAMCVVEGAEDDPFYGALLLTGPNAGEVGSLPGKTLMYAGGAKLRTSVVSTDWAVYAVPPKASAIELGTDGTDWYFVSRGVAYNVLTGETNAVRRGLFYVRDWAVFDKERDAILVKPDHTSNVNVMVM